MTIKYVKCFVAFLDMLGFRSKVMESQHDSETLEILLDSLKICGGFQNEGKKATNNLGEIRTISIQSRFFSDSIVFFLKEKPEDIAQLFLIIRYLQDRLWEKDICLRGAITVGDMYWPDTVHNQKNVTLGPAILEAHKLESQIAIYPRILISRSLKEYIENKDVKAWPFGRTGQLSKYIKQDKDREYFLDMLNCNVTRAIDEKLEEDDNTFSVVWTESSGSKRDEILRKIDEIIKENISSEDEKIRQKYGWLKSYLQDDQRP